MNHYPLSLLKILCILIAILFATNCMAQNRSARVKINDTVYAFEVAATPETRARGLMFRKNLEKNSGMLFVYPAEAYRQFYMKNTFIPLDIAFIDNQWIIEDIQHMNPLDETITYSNTPAQYVLEVNRGFFERVGLSVGDRLELIGSIPASR